MLSEFIPPKKELHGVLLGVFLLMAIPFGFISVTFVFAFLIMAPFILCLEVIVYVWK